MELTPNLEEAWLDYVTYSPHELALQWPKLRSLFIGEHATSTVRGAQLDYEPFLNEDLRELHLEGRTLGHRICMKSPRNNMEPLLRELKANFLLFYHRYPPSREARETVTATPRGPP